MTMYRGLVSAFTLLIALTGCSPTPTPAFTGPTASVAPSATLRPAPVSPSATVTTGFPTEAFAGLGDESVSAAMAAALQEVLDSAANGHGLTAAVISPLGTWNGATGLAAGDRAMVPGDQMSIASITKTLVAAQVMRLVEAGELSLDDFAADRLPPDLEFDANGVTIENLLSMRSGIPEYFADADLLEKALAADPLHVWTLDERLATVAPERGPAGQDWDYIGTNYVLLGLVIEQVTGRRVAKVLRNGVLAGDGYDRLIYQPDERPTAPMAMPLGAAAEAFEENGGYLPSLANVTMFTSEGAMASDALTLARWFRGLCAGQVVSPSSVDDMTDFVERPGYGLGVIDRAGEYWPSSGALGHKGSNTTVALCFQDPPSVVVVLANAEHDVDALAGKLVRAASY